MLRDEQELTDELRTLIIEKLKQYLHRQEKSQEWAAKSMDMAPATLSQIINGNYSGDDEGRVRKIDKWLELRVMKEQARKPAGFVKTNVAQQIYGVVKLVQKKGGIGLVHGPSGCGKTLTLRAIHAETTGSIFISVSTAGHSKLSVLQKIATAARIGDMKVSAAKLENQLISALQDTDRLIIIDEVHKLAGRRNDEALHALRDLHDATHCPMVWGGMTKIATYITDGNNEGHDPLEQIYRRIRIWLNLTEACNRANGGPGLFTVDDIRKVFAAQKIRLTDDGVGYLHEIANEPRMGSLGACDYLVSNVADMAGDRPISAQMLRDVRSQMLGARVAEALDRQMSLRITASA